MNPNRGETARRLAFGRILTAVTTAIAALAVIAVVWAANYQTNDIIMLPAPAEAIDSHITVSGHPLKPNRGTFYITFVSEPTPTLLTRFFEGFNADATILPQTDFYPTNTTPTQQQQVNTAMMVTSKTAAEIAAFSALGYHPELKPEIAVSQILKDSKAAGKLQVNDTILAANGRPIQTTQQLRDVVQAVQPGASISLLVSRPTGSDNETLHVSVPTVKLSGKAAIGVFLQPTGEAKLPYSVTIDSGDIEGPSAGLMFALGIINRLSPVDLTHGHKIAGTGTIDLNGNVGPIGGAKQKVIGAREAGARYFFVPATENYAEAKPFAKGITLVPVNTLNDALHFLRHLH